MIVHEFLFLILKKVGCTLYVVDFKSISFNYKNNIKIILEHVLI